MPFDNEPYRIPSHDEGRDALARYLRELGFRVWTEHTLPNGKIADVIALDPYDECYIFEVKTELKTSLAGAAFDKYSRYCDYLTVAIPGLLPSTWEQHRIVYLCDNKAVAVGVAGIEPVTLRLYFPPRDLSPHRENRLAMLHSLKQN